MITKKLALTIIIALFVVVIVLVTTLLLINVNQKRKIESINNEFISLWGTYDYNTFAEYPNKVRDYLDPAFFETVLGDKQSLYIRRARMISKNYSIKTRPIKTNKIDRTKDGYKIETRILETVTSKEENYEKEKNIKIIWIKVKNNWRVKELSY